MAFVVATKPGRFEIRESAGTPKGPRSRTLVSFRELDDSVVERAQEKAEKAIDAAELQRAARRAGAPVARPTADRAARELIAELGKGRRPDPTLRHMLLALLRHDRSDGAAPPPESEAESGVAEWMAASLEERGKALVDLLLLADALPHGGRKGKPLRFPRLNSSRQ
jgi:hypothetical protein